MERLRPVNIPIITNSKHPRFCNDIPQISAVEGVRKLQTSGVGIPSIHTQQKHGPSL